MKVILEFDIPEDEADVDHKPIYVRDLLAGEAKWPKDTVINADIDGAKHQFTLP